MRSLRSLCIVALCVAGVVSDYASGKESALPEPLAAALSEIGVPQEAVAVVVQEIGARQRSVEWRATTPMNPASTMKLLTTLAGLDLLGPSYSWRTEVYVDGNQADDVVQGDLVLKGYGDPRLTLDNFGMLLRELRARGIREITGDLVLDRSHFFLESNDPSRFDGEPSRPYNVLPDALLLNFKAARLQFVPRGDGQLVHVFSIPDLPELAIINQLNPTPGACVGAPERPESATENRLVFRADYGLDCGERTRSFAALSPDQYALSVFRRLWGELGGQLQGGVRVGHASPGAKLAMTWQSPPLADVIRDINKFSNNVMARQLFLTLSADADPPGTTEKSAARVRKWLHEGGIDASELVLENGAGLSRSERISADSLARILLRGFAAQWMPEYVSSLPIAGVDGTTRRRLGDSPAAGRAHIKTGYLEGVRAIAGYVLDKQDRWLVVVSLINHAGAGGAQRFQDAVIEWAYQSGASGCCARCRGADHAGKCARQPGAAGMR